MLLHKTAHASSVATSFTRASLLAVRFRDMSGTLKLYNGPSVHAAMGRGVVVGVEVGVDVPVVVASPFAATIQQKNAEQGVCEY